MASTETRSGFRLPWSSDRSHDEPAESSTEPTSEAAEPTDDANALAWPETDLSARPIFNSPEPGTPEAEPNDGPTAEESPMPDTNPVTSAPPATPKKSSKLMSDLSAAIRSTAEAARDQSLAQADADARQAKETIREQSTEGAAALRQHSDDDIAGIREWSKAEIARIREETDQKISDRKATLEDELGEHAASVERRIGDVDEEVARHQAAMDAYLERLRAEEDPARLATLAEQMPETPSFEAWLGTTVEETGADIEATVEDETTEASGEAEASADVETIADGETTEASGEAEAEASEIADAASGEAEADVVGEVEPAVDDEVISVADGEYAVAPDADGQLEPVEGSDEAAAEGEAEATVEGEAEASAEAEAPEATTARAWGEPDGDWTTPSTTTDEARDGDVPRWAAGETPEGFPTDDGGGDPVDRGAIMAALEAAAEAVVAAESASDSADQAEAAADVAETAAELFRGQQDHETVPVEYVPQGDSAVDDVESESFAGRLASLLPGHGGGDVEGEPQTSKVIATGLISVASIASFKRHLGRVPGVQGVSVSSGPDGEFVFNVTHRPDVAFRDVIPTLPGFAARVVSAEDGVIRVTAQDPEAGS